MAMRWTGELPSAGRVRFRGWPAEEGETTVGIVNGEPYEVDGEGYVPVYVPEGGRQVVVWAGNLVREEEA